MSGNDRTWAEILAMFVGALVIGFAGSAGWWWVAHQLAWWTYAAATTAWLVGWQFAKAGVKEWRKARRKRLAAQTIGERLLAARRNSGLS